MEVEDQHVHGVPSIQIKLATSKTARANAKCQSGYSQIPQKRQIGFAVSTSVIKKPTHSTPNNTNSATKYLGDNNKTIDLFLTTEMTKAILIHNLSYEPLKLFGLTFAEKF